MSSITGEEAYILAMNYTDKVAEQVNGTSIDDENIKPDATWSSEKIANDYSSKEYVADQISNSLHLVKEIVDEIPVVEDAKENVIYMIKDDNATNGDVYKEYQLINGEIVQTGDTSIDLTDYVKKEDVPNLDDVAIIDDEIIEKDSVWSSEKTVTEMLNQYDRYVRIKGMSGYRFSSINMLLSDLDYVYQNRTPYEIGYGWKITEVETNGGTPSEILVSITDNPDDYFSSIINVGCYGGDYKDAIVYVNTYAGDTPFEVIFAGNLTKPVVVDEELDIESTNAIQNKTVAEALDGIMNTYISIGDLNARKGLSISLVANEDNTQQIIDALDVREQFVEWFGNSNDRFGISPKTYGDRINELRIIKTTETNAIITAIMNSGAVLSRLYTGGTLGDWTSTGHILTDGYMDDGTISITGSSEDSSGMYGNGVLPETLGFSRDAMTWANGCYRISNMTDLVGLPDNLQLGRLEHFNLKRWKGNHNPHTKDWAERMSVFYSDNGNIYTRLQISGATAGTITTDTGWRCVTQNTKALVTNAQNFKIDLTKRNASWYGMFTFNFTYGSTPCEITVTIIDKVYYTITKGQNVVSAITYTQDGAKYTIGIDFTTKMYGTQVVEIPSEFGTINSLTAEQFAGDTTAISKGQDCNEIIYTSLSGNLAGITTVLDLVNALVTEYRALSSKKPIRFVSGEITKTTLTDLPRNYGLLQITVFGYDVVEVSFAGSSFGFKTLHYGFVNRTSGEALFSSLFWEIVDTPVTELIDLGLDGSATIQNVMDVMTIGQHCILNTSRFDDKTQVDNIEYGKVEIRRLSSGMWSLWLEDVLHGNVVAHGTCSNGKFAGWHYFTTKSYVDNLIADLQAQIDALK